MRDFLTLDDIELSGKTVLLRVDLNVPMKDGIVKDSNRIERLLPTLRKLASAQCKTVILSHLGRPDGKVNPDYSLRPVALELARILGQDVAFASDCIGAVARDAVAKLKGGEFLVLENTRFHAEEEANDPEFARQLASLGEVFVSDAFAAAHRAHASTAAVAEFLPSVAGCLMQEELDALTRFFVNPDRPLMAIVGGAKISTKLDLLNNLVTKTDMLVMGGGMANTFLAAKGYNIGQSLVEKGMLDTARTIMDKANKYNCQIILPSDVVIAAELREGAPAHTVAVDAVPDDMKIFDLGAETVTEICRCIDTCRTIVWNGPLGVFEISMFDVATRTVAWHVANRTREGKIVSLAGGGDTVAALTAAGSSVMSAFTYVSTAGGAFLEWLEGKELPGVAALRHVR